MTDVGLSAHLAQIGQRIRDLREALGLDVDVVAAHIGIAASALTEIEQGSVSEASRVSIAAVFQLAAVLEVDAGQLLSGGLANSKRKQ